MSYKVKVLSNVDSEEWNSALKNSNDSTVYQTSNWINSIQQDISAKPIFILVYNDSEKIVGQLAAFIDIDTLRHFKRVSRVIAKALKISTLTWHYGPIIHNHENKEEILFEIFRTIDKIASEQKLSLIRGDTIPSEESNRLSLFSEFNYKLLPWSTYTIELSNDANDLYRKFDKKTRYDIRKSQEKGYEFISSQEKSSYQEYILQKLKSRRNKINYNYSKEDLVSNAKWNLLSSQGLDKVFLVRYNGKPVSGNYNLLFNGNMVQHGVGTQKGLSGSYLTWKVIQWAIHQNLKRYDLGGVNPNPNSKKEEGIAFFKSKWGGRKLGFFQITKVLDKYKINASRLLKRL